MPKQLFTLLFLIGLSAFACSKKQADVEMQLPTSIPTVTPVISVTATETSSSPVPTPTETPEPMAYIIEDLKGTVYIIQRGSTELEAAELEEAVEAGDEIITKKNSEVSLTLNSMTMIHLSADSSVKISELKPNGPKGFTSRLKLILGKVLSEVEKLGGSGSVFEVEAGGVICGVRGTSFEVQTQKDTVSASTFSGVIEMKKDKKRQLVKANQRSAFSKKKKIFLAQRALNKAEKNRYKGWLKQKAVIGKKRLERTKLLQTMAFLPLEERNSLKERLSLVGQRSRVRVLHQLLKERKLEKQGGGRRLKTLLPKEKPIIQRSKTSLREKTPSLKKGPLLKRKKSGRQGKKKSSANKDDSSRQKVSLPNPKPGHGVFDKNKKRKPIKKQKPKPTPEN